MDLGVFASMGYDVCPHNSELVFLLLVSRETDLMNVRPQNPHRKDLTRVMRYVPDS